MKYDRSFFDTPVDRMGTNCEKWDDTCFSLSSIRTRMDSAMPNSSLSNLYVLFFIRLFLVV